MRLIDADKLNIYDVSPAYGTCVMGVTEEDIELAPTVDAVPVRHGHWIYVSFDNENHNALYQCSECGCGEVHCPEVDTKYCWNCGARMDGETE